MYLLGDLLMDPHAQTPRRNCGLVPPAQELWLVGTPGWVGSSLCSQREARGHGVREVKGQKSEAEVASGPQGTLLAGGVGVGAPSW